VAAAIAAATRIPVAIVSGCQLRGRSDIW
jgi:hypothetical protein